MSEEPSIDRDGPHGNLDPGQVDRLFDLLEKTVENDALTSQQFERMLSILEQALVSPAATDPDTLAELLTMMEEFIVEPEDLSEVDIDGILGLFEEALAGVTVTDPADLESIFDVLEEALHDPASIDPDDVDRFQSSIQNALLDVTGEGGLGRLLFFPALTEDDSEQPTEPLRIARLATAMTQQAGGHSVESGLRTGTRLAYAAVNAQSPMELLTTARAITLDELDRAGIDIGEEQEAWLEAHGEEAVHPRPLTREALAERGERLISQSAELGRDEDVHPAFGPMLDELATDEARILRLLALEGPQGVVDVYDRQYLPPNSTPVETNLTMLGQDAGCRTPARTPLYVQNLERLRLVEIRDQPIDNLKRYEIIEAQSHVELARKRAKRPRVIYKQIRLTDLGVEFCRLCFPFEVSVDAPGMRLRRDSGG